VKRLIWFVIGTAVGIYAVTRLKKKAQVLAPESLQASAEKMASAIRHFGDEVRAGMAERETELRDALGIDTAAGDTIHKDDR
jgi:F0F1-type ATP synthase membrane subunit a